MKHNSNFIKWSPVFWVAVTLSMFNMPQLWAADTDVSRESASVEEAKQQLMDQMLKDTESVLQPAAPEPVVTEPEERPSSIKAALGESFTVKKIKFLGNSSISDAELEAMTQNLINQPIQFQDIEDSLKKIKQQYRVKGYIAAYAYVPPQEIKEDTLKIDVLEGRIDKVSLAGQKYFSEAALRDRIRLAPGEVLTYESLRSSLARLSKHRDVKAKAVLEAGESLGTTHVKINVEDKAPYHLGGEVNNFGTKNTGTYRYGVNGSHTNLTGHMDELRTRWQFGDDVLGATAGYDFPILPKTDTHMGYQYSMTDVKVGGAFRALRTEGDSATHTVYVTQPLYEKEKLNIDGRLSFDSKESKNFILGDQRSHDQLSVLSPSLTLDWTEKEHRTLSGQTLAFGLDDFLGSMPKTSRTSSRVGAGGQFFAYKGNLIHAHKLPWDLTGIVRGNWQLTGDPLPPSEQISTGGANSVRGYQESEYLGDFGGYMNIDILIPAFFVPADWKLPYFQETLAKQLQVVTFMDMSYAGLKKPQVGEFKERSLSSLGTGLRFRIKEGWVGKFEWGFPTGDGPLDHRASAYHFTVSYDMF